MIVREAKGFSGRAYIVIPRDADDLFTLRRTIENGDFVVGDTTRVIKHLKQYGRPERGERVKVRVSLKVENTALYDAVDRLRITGIITNTDNELVSIGSHHSMTVRIDDTIMIEKERKWHNAELSYSNQIGKHRRFYLGRDRYTRGISRKGFRYSYKANSKYIFWAKWKTLPVV